MSSVDEGAAVGGGEINGDATITCIGVFAKICEKYHVIE